MQMMMSGTLQGAGTGGVGVKAMRNRLWTVGFLAVALASAEAAASVVYDEAVGGDLPDNLFSPRDLGDVGIGLNTVSGTIVGVTTNMTDIDRYDSFKVNVPVGLQISSVVVAIDPFSLFVATDKGSVLFADGPDIIEKLEFVAAGGVAFTPPFDVLAPTFAAYTAGPTGQVNFSYIFTIDVERRSVSEPATLALFGLGLAGLGAMRRKKLAA